MSRIKVKTEDVTEVYVARSKLDGVLQTLVDQKEDGATPEKDALNHPDTDSEMFDSPLSSPAKKSPRIGRFHRKRKIIKEEATSTDNMSSNSCVMKLFDRTVDLAPFSEDTPLYPVCRAWIRNQYYPSLPKRLSQNTENEPVIGPMVCDLPEPTVIKLEKSEEVYPSMPSPVKQDEEPFIINENSSSVEPEKLFLNHMVRWKKVRQKWKNASRDNEMRYIESYKILKDMFEKNTRDL